MKIVHGTGVIRNGIKGLFKVAGSHAKQMVNISETVQDST